MGGGQALQQVVFFGLLLLGLYLLAIRPQRTRARAMAQVQAELTLGSRVVTSAGIEAVVTGLEQDAVVLQIAPGVEVRFLRGAVVRVLDDDALGSDQATGPGAEPDR